jgi:serine/threonine-protein kinase
MPPMTTNAATDPMIGRMIDQRYRVRSRIARGGMATVYLATDVRLERRVAIKVMHGHLADDAAFRERFIQEARSAARLSHPNLVGVYDQGAEADTAYIVMEYIPGITLRDLLQEHHALTPEQATDILRAVLAGFDVDLFEDKGDGFWQFHAVRRGTA